jgi:hypothetical protein
VGTVARRVICGVAVRWPFPFLGVFMFRFFAFSVLAISMAACSNVDDTQADVTLIDDSTEGALSFASGANTTHLFMGVANEASIATSGAVFFGDFDLLPRGRVDIVLTSPERGLGFTVYRVGAQGDLQWIGQANGRGRRLAARLTTTNGGTFVIETTASTPMVMGLDVTCARNDGKCAPLAQPGATCGTRGAGPCDGGLFCSFPSICGADDRGGVCAIPPTICEASCNVVCGCDGQDYCNNCTASSAGVSVLHDGSCAPVCDASTFVKADTSDGINPIGVWTATASTDDFNIVATLRLNDGDFSYEQVWNPSCLPLCRRASYLHSMVGGWENNGNNIQLLVDQTNGPAPEMLAQGFSVEKTCGFSPDGTPFVGDVRLVTTELGVERIFSRDRCAETICTDEEHCELQQVFCIQAPCPAQPVCVAN